MNTHHLTTLIAPYTRTNLADFTRQAAELVAEGDRTAPDFALWSAELSAA
jgi:hypothetical protein